MSAPKKKKKKRYRPCKWCALGAERDKNGDHWIVRSVIPARMTIKKCSQPRAPEEPGT